MKNWMLTALMAMVVVAMGSPWALAQDAPAAETVAEAPVAELEPVEAPAEAPAEQDDAVAAVMEAVQDAIEDAIADAAPAAVPEAVEADPER